MILRNQAYLATFVIVDNFGAEITGLGDAFNVFVSALGAPFAPGTGDKAEVGNGWYSYLIPAAETDISGPLSLYITATGAVQQNIYFNVGASSIYAVNFSYTVIDTSTLLPLDNVMVWFTTDIAGQFVVWTGITDIFGVTRDSNGNLPFLDPGIYYVWRKRAGYTFDNPDTEVVT